AERIRLLYVATTRAESRLAVSGHGYALSKASKPKPLSLWGSLFGSVVEEPDAPELVAYGQDMLQSAPVPAVEVPDAHEWAKRSRIVSEGSAERAGWSATRIVHPAEPAGDDAQGAHGVQGAAADAPQDGAAPPLPEQRAAVLRERSNPEPAHAEDLPAPPRSSPVAAGPDVGTAVHHLAEHSDLRGLHDPDTDTAAALADWQGWAED